MSCEGQWCVVRCMQMSVEEGCWFCAVGRRVGELVFMDVWVEVSRRSERMSPLLS